jgi:hypothetical protein
VKLVPEMIRVDQSDSGNREHSRNEETITHPT